MLEYFQNVMLEWMHNLIKILAILSDVSSSLKINCFNVHLLIKRYDRCDSWSIVLFQVSGRHKTCPHNPILILHLKNLIYWKFSWLIACIQSNVSFWGLLFEDKQCYKLERVDKCQNTVIILMTSHHTLFLACFSVIVS